jgi:uncharacterized coiled-coil protein SlyX
MSPHPPSPTERITELEGLFTHLQRTMKDLDQVVIEQARRIVQLERELNLLAGELRAVRDFSREPRRPEDEIPPHY